MASKKGIPMEKILELHNQGMYDADIAEALGCSRSNITIRLNQAGISNRHGKMDDIDMRNRISDSLIGRYCGQNNPNFHHGDNIKVLARGVYKTISKRLRRNSSGVCCNCGRKSDNLVAHHIKPFKVIFKDFMSNVYNGDIDTAYDQIVAYGEFTDETNIVVLCPQCHHDVHYSDNPELSHLRWGSATTIPSGSKAQAIGV